LTNPEKRKKRPAIIRTERVIKSNGWLCSSLEQNFVFLYSKINDQTEKIKRKKAPRD
jgi:hypothetical protein